jgi:microcystin-dependent protein
MEPFIGQIELFPYDFEPMDWTTCDGKILQVNSNPALFSLLGTRFGGDGRTTFAVPDLSKASPNPNLRYCIALRGLYPTRS